MGHSSGDEVDECEYHPLPHSIPQLMSLWSAVVRVGMRCVGVSVVFDSFRVDSFTPSPLLFMQYTKASRMTSHEKVEGGRGGVGSGCGFGDGDFGCWDSKFHVRVGGKGSEGLQRAMCRGAPVSVLRGLAERWVGMSADGKWRVGEEVGKVVKDLEVVRVIGGWAEEVKGKRVVVEGEGGEEEARKVAMVFGGIRGVWISVESMDALTKEMLEVVHEINLSERGIRDDDIVVLSKALSSLPYLHTLSLHTNGFSAVGMMALARVFCTHGSFPSLHTLQLGFNDIRAAGMIALSRALSTPGSFPSLQALHLGSNDIGDEGMVALSNAISTPHSFQCLRLLQLYNNLIGDEGMVALAHALSTPGTLPYLHTLNFNSNMIGADGMSALCSAFSTPGSLPSLHTLNFNSNMIGADGMSALCSAFSTPGSLPSLHTLHLHRNNIQNAGIVALSHAISTSNLPPSLHTLYIGYNNIGDEGVMALSRALITPGSFPRLHSLILFGNSIGAEGAAALAKLSRHKPSLQLSY